MLFRLSRITILCFLFTVCISSAIASDSTFAFRSKNVFQSDAKGIFDRIKWQIKFDGPIRSSVSSDGQTYYTGTTRGSLYAFESKTGNTRWAYRTAPINSTPAVEKNNVYFTNNEQALICLDTRSGKQKWETSLGASLDYSWGFDNYYSSPVIGNSSLYVGSHDGHLYSVDKNSGHVKWKFNARAIIRSTPIMDGKRIYFGDVNGYVYCINMNDGAIVWKSATRGTSYDNTKFGYDRRAIIGSAALTDQYCIIGSRDGGLYAFNKNNGDTAWHFSYGTSWVISTPVISKYLVISATSDGKCINAIDLHTGKEIWKTTTRQIVWSSPIIVNDIVYAGDNEGIFYAIDLLTGNKLSEVRTKGGILSSPVYSNGSIVFSNDEGRIYSLQPSVTKPGNREKYVYWQKQPAGIYFRNNIDERIKNFLTDNNYVLADTNMLEDIIKNRSGSSEVIFVNGIIPEKLLAGGKESAFRRYLDNGGQVIFTNLNPVLFDLFNPALTLGLNADRTKNILDLDYGANDLRSAKGVFASFATAEGKALSLPEYWLAGFAISRQQIDVPLGIDERGNASAWKKHYRSGGSITQVWLDPAREEDYRYLIHLVK